MEVSTIIVKQKDLGCNATKVHIMDQDLQTNDAQTRQFWKTLGGKADVPGTCNNVQNNCIVMVCLAQLFPVGLLPELLYGLYRYVSWDRVWFLRFLGLLK